MTLDTHRLAWLAGFWDGEGCVSLAATRHATPHFVLGQAGNEGEALCRRVLDIAEVVGIHGNLNGPYGSYGASKRRTPFYMARITGGEQVQALLVACRPWLSETKITQAENALRRWRDWRKEHNVWAPGTKPTCLRGHPFSEENTYHSATGRQCRTCAIERSKGRYRKLREGVPAKVHVRPTHCPKGHPYDEANTYVQPSNNSRKCRICAREGVAAWRRKKKAG